MQAVYSGVLVYDFVRDVLKIVEVISMQAVYSGVLVYDFIRDLKDSG